MMTDIIADSLSRIRNATQRKLNTTTLLYSKLIESLVSILVDKGYIEDYKIKETDNNKKFIKVILKYNIDSTTVITEIKKISKPGRRVYKSCKDIKSFKNGYGTLILSTNKGVLPNDKAFKLGVGGEVICSVW